VPSVARFLAPIALLLALLASGRASADLGHDVDALERAWRSEGRVIRLAPQLHERGETRYLGVPERALRSQRHPCTTIAIVGVPGSSFVLRFETTEQDEQPQPPIRSRVGIIELTRCERGRQALGAAVVELRSPRAVLETMVLLSTGPPGEAYRVLPQRLPGPTGTAVDPGRAPTTRDIVARAKRLVSRMTQRGAHQVDHGLLRSDLDGSGISAVDLEAGCHEVTVMGVSAPADAPRSVDIDVDFAWPSGELAASDRTDAPDATIQLCVAQQRRLALRFAGALPTSPVLFVHGRWDLPAGLDSRWRPEVRAGLAQALREHHLRTGDGRVVAQSLGIAGVTGIPVEVAPDACYVVGVAVYRGQTAGVASAVATGSRRYQNHGGPAGKSTALAFCARGARSAVIEVEAVGSGGLAWHLVMWRSGSVRPGEVVE
jgi:hypothetical protein